MWPEILLFLSPKPTFTRQCVRKDCNISQHVFVFLFLRINHCISVTLQAGKPNQSDIPGSDVMHRLPVWVRKDTALSGDSVNAPVFPFILFALCYNKEVIINGDNSWSMPCGKHVMFQGTMNTCSPKSPDDVMRGLDCCYCHDLFFSMRQTLEIGLDL